MGIKGSKLSNEASSSTELFLERLKAISGLSSKKMFGGYGIFHEGKMFALVNSQGEVYLKSDDTLKSKFEDTGSHAHGRMPYFSIPEEVFNDYENLISWAQASIAISK